MKEIVDLVAAWRSLPPGSEAVLATVIGTSGSTYRRPGARMLLTRSAWLAGSISGGCLESDVMQNAWDRTAGGPALVSYDATSDDDIVWGFGLGCNGIVQVLLERLAPDGGPLGFLAQVVESRIAGIMTTVISEGSSVGRHWLSSSSAVDKISARMLGTACHEIHIIDTDTVLFESILPPRPLLIYGAGHDAVPVVRAAKALGWHVTVVAPRPIDKRRFADADEQAASLPEVDGQTAAVIMTHNYLSDKAALESLLLSPIGYVGLLGPRVRTDRILSDLRDSGVLLSQDQLAKLHAPIGLDIGSDGADEIALAIVAEIQAFFNGRAGGFLKDKVDPLHSKVVSSLSTANSEAPSCSLLP